MSNESSRLINIKSIIAIILAMTATHIFAINYGYYSGDVWIDQPLHFAGGFLAAMTGYWGLSFAGIRKMFGTLNLFATCVMLASFSLVASFLWELFEFGLLTCCESWARTGRLISPSVADVLSDMGLGLAGGIVFVNGLVFVAAGKP
jgi:hypothetical protein